MEKEEIRNKAIELLKALKNMTYAEIEEVSFVIREIARKQSVLV